MPGRAHLNGRPVRPRRPARLRVGPAALLPTLVPTLVPALLLAGCTGAVELRVPDLVGDDLAACTAFTADLPPSLAGEDPREVDPPDALGAAYGDPAYVVRCGVPVPTDFDEAVSACEVAEGVGWYVAPEEFDDQDADVTLTAAGYRPVVSVTVPGDERPEGPAAAIAELAPVVDEHLVLVENCD